ncbi:MAG: hypothetical protein GF405_04580 [Candidatus Eisenbacteria bacterium]|nr:hypothetical protein [Candidatus Eisenbacteria bacterium]
MSPGLRTVFVALALLSALTFAASGAGWMRETSGHLTVEFASGDELAARRVLEIGAGASERLHRQMGVESPADIRVVVAPDETTFRELTGGAVPEWGVGVAYASRSLIVLRSPRIIDYPLALGQIVVHELAHVATERGLRGVRAPRWFHEGVAMMSAGEWRLGNLDAMVARVEGGGTIPLSELDASFPYGSSDAAAAYVESFFAVNHLAETSGIGTAPGVVRAIAAAGSFDEGVARLTGQARASFEESVLGEMNRSYRLPMFLRSGRLLFLVIAVLVIVAVIVRAATSRRRLEALSDSDGGPPRWRPGSDSSWE